VVEFIGLQMMAQDVGSQMLVIDMGLHLTSRIVNCWTVSRWLWLLL